MDIQDATHEKRLVIGCGTGRCGSVSLVKFLNSQPGFAMLHEGVTDSAQGIHHLVPWYGGEEKLWPWLTELEKMSGDAGWYGDVGPYFLRYLPLIFDRYPDSRAICLERDRKAMIDSYLTKTEGRNHWYPHHGLGWQEDPEWDDAYPTYAEPDKRKALALYWDQYHSAAMEYLARFPRQFMLVSTESLNKVGQLREILGFLGHDPNVVGAARFHANASYSQRFKRYWARLSAPWDEKRNYR